MERLKSNIKELVNDFTTDDVEMLDTTAIILKFNANIPVETVDWICNLIARPISSGGAGVKVQKYESDDDDSNSSYYIISASLQQFFCAAERYQLLKRTHEGHLLPFSLENRHKFESYEDDNEEFFLPSEKQFLLKQALDHVTCEEEETRNVPQFEKVKIYKNRPVYDIKSYFGENIALYFAFLEFYTKFLIPPAIIGLCNWLFVMDENRAENVWFAILNLVWATIFLELWKRKSSSIVFDWGRLTNPHESSKLLEEPRAEYKGHPRINPVTGLPEPYYPTWRRRLKMYLVSYPVLLISLVFAMSGMWLYFQFQEKMAKTYKDASGFWSMIIKKLPGILYAAAIYGLNNAYGRIAVKLNDWENHRVQSTYNNHLIVKLVFFYFINSFLSLFYIAFYLCDMALLRQQLATQLITQQLIQQVQESGIPYIQFKKNNIQAKKKGKTLVLQRIRDPKNQVIREGNMPCYSNTFGDYLEMFTQFGYVFMFSAAYPLAGFWALVNNMVEIRTDAFKLCKLHQRPFAQPTSSIGVWQSAFDLMSIIAVMTNCAIIALSNSTQQWFEMENKPIQYILMFVIFEHFLIMLKVLIAKLIPDIPGSITKLLAKAEYKAQQESKEKSLYHLVAHEK